MPLRTREVVQKRGGETEGRWYDEFAKGTHLQCILDFVTAHAGCDN